ncbi:MAG TPA: NAD-dependent epimerase/dehydratase family protein [Spirochaetia bacterium]|nr:NAD-dependent epimerase/dehydratase family protein [Spirochaetia bacterium]
MTELRRCLVMGGAGMLGYEVVRQLIDGGREVRVLDLERLDDPRCDVVVGDIRDPAVVRQACRGMDAVIQTAAAVWDVRTPRAVYEKVNVGGNRIVIEACRAAGVQRLVYTSSMDVVVDGRKPIVDGDESLPYPSRLPRDAYSRSKIVAEKMILEANGPGLATCVLRPVGMYGPRDRYHLGNIIGMARRGVSLRLGDGSARFSHAYSENVAHAHVLAAERLFPGSPVAGQCYFICDHYPAENLFDFMEPFLRELGLPVPRRSIPYRLAYALAAVAVVFAPRSNFNRFAVVQTCVDHTFVDARAARDLDYRPIVSREEAFRRSVEWLTRDSRASGTSPARSRRSAASGA